MNLNTNKMKETLYIRF